MTTTWREFTAVDWMGMAGAEPFANGCEPLTTDDIRVDGEAATFIIDANGLAFLSFSEDGDPILSGWIRESAVGLPHSVGLAARFVALTTFPAGTPLQFTRSELEESGFEVQEAR